MRTDTKSIILLIMLLLLCATMSLTLVGCDDEKKPVIHWKVYRENAPKDFTIWVMPEEPDIEGAFVCWEQDGNAVCISGKITIQSFIAGE